MSKLNVRVLLSVLISLGIIFAVYTTVQGASFTAAQTGSHAVSGLMTNFNHDRLTLAEQGAYQAQFQPYNSSRSDSGHGCDSQAINPLDD